MTPTEYKQNGRPIEKNKKIQGYLDFNKREAIQLLKYYT